MRSEKKEAPWGPWLGVSHKRQSLCAVEGCTSPGRAGRCVADGSFHHHGCVHYDCPAVGETGLVFRQGWGLLCDEHYAVVAAAAEGRRTAS